VKRLYRKWPARKQSVFSAILRNNILPDIFKIGECNMWRKFSMLKVKAGAAQSSFDFRLQMRKRCARARARPKSAGLFAAKKVGPEKLHLKSRRGNIGERLMRISKPMAIHLANESERQMEILHRPPARAVNPILEC